MPKYYDAWEPGVFPAQRALCLVLQDSAHPIEEPDLNPLTIRLATAYQALNALDQRIQEASRGLSRLWQEALALWGEAAAAGAVAFTEETVSSPLGEAQTVAAVALLGEHGILKTHRLPGDQVLAFPMMEAQQLLWQFLAGYCGALDRLAWEVGRLFVLSNKETGWRELTQWKGGRNRLLRQLQEKEPALFAWLSGFHTTDLEVALKYLDTCQHLGYIPAKAAVDTPTRRWRLWTAPAVDDTPVELNIDAVQLCRLLMKEGLTVINTTYHILYRHYEEHGLPSW